MKIAVIPARAGSKRIPNKNIRDFNGKPLISYSITSAVSSGLFDKVFVSTDSEKIAEIAKSYGAEVPFLRSEENSNDHATITDMLEEFLNKLEEGGQSVTEICLIYSTAPLISSEDLIKSHKSFASSDADTVIAVTEFTFPIQRALQLRDGKIFFQNEEHVFTRSQDLETFYHDTGSFFWIRPESFKAQRTIFCENTVPYVIDPIRVQDIDVESDWEICEFKYKFLNR